MHRTHLHLQSDISQQFIFHIYGIIIASLLKLLRGALSHLLLPRTTFVWRKLVVTKRLERLSGRLGTLPFNSTFILYRVFSTLCANSHLRRRSRILKQKMQIFGCPDELMFLYKPHKLRMCPSRKECQFVFESLHPSRDTF